MARKKEDKPQRLCWDCVFAKPYYDEKYMTPEGGPIFYHCHQDHAHVKRGLMDNTIACINFKRKETI